MTVKQLINEIKSTNNGYLFNPTGEEIEIAKENPDEFVVQEIRGSIFPFKIYLK